jgi:hypothetical protein
LVSAQAPGPHAATQHPNAFLLQQLCNENLSQQTVSQFKVRQQLLIAEGEEPPQPKDWASPNSMLLLGVHQGIGEIARRKREKKLNDHNGVVNCLKQVFSNNSGLTMTANAGHVFAHGVNCPMLPIDVDCGKVMTPGLQMEKLNAFKVRTDHYRWNGRPKVLPYSLGHLHRAQPEKLVWFIKSWLNAMDPQTFASFQERAVVAFKQMLP